MRYSYDFTYDAFLPLISSASEKLNDSIINEVSLKKAMKLHMEVFEFLKRVEKNNYFLTCRFFIVISCTVYVLFVSQANSVRGESYELWFIVNVLGTIYNVNYTIVIIAVCTTTKNEVRYVNFLTIFVVTIIISYYVYHREAF